MYGTYSCLINGPLLRSLTQLQFRVGQMCHNYVPTVTDSAEANTGNHSNYYEIISYIQLGEENLSHQFCIFCCTCKVLSCKMKIISVQVGKVGVFSVNL